MLCEKVSHMLCETVGKSGLLPESWRPFRCCVKVTPAGRNDVLRRVVSKCKKFNVEVVQVFYGQEEGDEAGRDAGAK